MMNARLSVAAFMMLLALFLGSALAHAELSLEAAEKMALAASSRLRASEADVEAASEQREAAWSLLLPRLTFQANYTYLSSLPELKVSPAAAPVTFGSHNNVNLGPVLSYTLWDSFSSLKSYRAIQKIEAAKKEERVLSKVQLLMALRSAYVACQLSSEERKAVSGSLKLAKLQEKDIANKSAAGAASKVDRLLAKRHVLAMQMKEDVVRAQQRLAFVELASLTGDAKTGDAKSEPVLEPLMQTVQHLAEAQTRAPDNEQPQIKRQLLLADSADLAADAQKAKVFPSLQVSASTTLAYPNGPQTVVFNQNTLSALLVVPLYLGDPNWHLSSQKHNEARSARLMAQQFKNDLSRDFEKAQSLVESLKAQQRLAQADVEEANDIANLLYDAYKEGRRQLLDVQSANNDALQAKINAARIDAQLANQYIALIALFGKGDDA